MIIFGTISSTYHPHGVVVLILFDSPLCTLHRLSHLPCYSLDLHLNLPMWVGSVRSTECTSANEELGTLAENIPLTELVCCQITECQSTQFKSLSIW